MRDAENGNERRQSRLTAQDADDAHALGSATTSCCQAPKEGAREGIVRGLAGSEGRLLAKLCGDLSASCALEPPSEDES